MFACFTMMFTVPTADANRAAMVEPNGSMSVAPTPTAYPNGNTMTNNFNRAATGVENGVNRTITGVENGMNRAITGVENGVNRTVTGLENGVNNGTRGYNAYSTNNNTYNRHNVNANRANYRATANTTTTANRGFSWGWLGLLGLFGLAGMRSRDRDRA